MGWDEEGQAQSPLAIVAAHLPRIKIRPSASSQSLYSLASGCSTRRADLATPATANSSDKHGGSGSSSSGAFSVLALVVMVALAAFLFVATGWAYGREASVALVGSSFEEHRQACSAIVLNSLYAEPEGQSNEWSMLQGSRCALLPLPEPGACNSIRAIVGVMSTAEDWRRRDLIRGTWKEYPNVYHHARNPTGSILVVFVIGLPNQTVDTEVAGDLAAESLAHRDLWLLRVRENMNDGKTAAWYRAAWERYGVQTAATSAAVAAAEARAAEVYFAATAANSSGGGGGGGDGGFGIGGISSSKGSSSSKGNNGSAVASAPAMAAAPAAAVSRQWSCPGLQWVGKGDQDSYVRTLPLEAEMERPEMAPVSTYWGYMIKCTSCSPGEFQVPSGAVDVNLSFGFATGMLQMLSADLAAWLGTSDIPATWGVGKEDVNVGYWLARGEYEGQLKYRIVNDRRFHDWAKGNETWWAFRKPAPDSIVIHKVYTDAEFRQLWATYPDETGFTLHRDSAEGGGEGSDGGAMETAASAAARVPPRLLLRRR